MDLREMVPLAVGIIGAVLALVSWLRNTKGDTSEQVSRMVRMETKLNHIAEEVIKYGNILERLMKVESDTKVNYQRLDDLQERLSRIEHQNTDIKASFAELRAMINHRGGSV